MIKTDIHIIPTVAFVSGASHNCLIVMLEITSQLDVLARDIIFVSSRRDVLICKQRTLLYVNILIGCLHEPNNVRVIQDGRTILCYLELQTCNSELFVIITSFILNERSVLI